jgi:hypothetical protein
MTTGIGSGMDWIRLIRLLDLQLHPVLIITHYGDGPNDGTPAGKNQHQDGHQY